VIGSRPFRHRLGGRAIPIIVGDLGQRLIAALGFDARTFFLGITLTALAVIVVLIREGRVLAGSDDGPRREPLDGVIVALTVAVASIVIERALSILL
jgi:hypothetical protein